MNGSIPESLRTLFKAMDAGNLSAIKTLLELNPDNANGRSLLGSTPLHHAAFNGETSVAQLLIEKGANPKAKDKDGATPLNWAYHGANGRQDRNEPMIQLLEDALMAYERGPSQQDSASLTAVLSGFNKLTGGQSK